MKGGKRLTEEERFRLRQLLFVIAGKPDGEEKNIAISESLSIVSRDDEPEFCTWKENAVFHGFFHPSCVRENSADYPEPADMRFCPYCGKPVKGE